uniref:RagB/SusD family nutrient uptake outer membrane protein n=1 Tax=Segatella copri TaxID=165179 RepID=UPI0025ED8836|nr:RagB/SusD family nutrient uptake outer membrane protein [Prevotella sp.]
MKYNIFKGGAVVCAALMMASCSDFLDVAPRNKISDAAVWSNVDLANAALTDCYTYVEGENENGVPFSSYTDDVYHRTGYATEVYTMGNVSCDNYNVGYSEARGNTWYFYYKAIKQVNELLDNIGGVYAAEGSSDATKKKLIEGQAYFLRAFFYHQLYSLYGRVPLIYHVQDIDSEWKETRAPMDEVADSICKDCDRAAEILPTAYSSSDDFGRATKGAALAVKARTLLYKASPLFGTPSKERWQAASDANKAVIDLNAYSLPSVNSADEYAALFYNIENPEIIFEKLYNTKDPEGGALNYLFQAPMGAFAGGHGWGVWLPTYNAANMFENADGTKFEMKNVKSYAIKEATVEDGKVVYKDATIDATTDSPYQGREMRFYANFIYDGSKWGYGDDNRTIGIFEPGEEGVKGGNSSACNTDDEYWNATKTGYYMKKFLNPEYNTDQEDEMDTTPWIFFRLAEIYLNYAECQMELGNKDEALKYINLVRQRVHLPAATGADLRAEYEYERRAELMFEGQRFFDLRRWKKMPEVYSGDNLPTAMKIYKMKDGTLLYSHDKTVLQQRNFRDAMYWMPVPRYELNKCPNLDGAPYEGTEK